MASCSAQSAVFDAIAGRKLIHSMTLMMIDQPVKMTQLATPIHVVLGIRMAKARMPPNKIQVTMVQAVRMTLYLLVGEALVGFDRTL